MKRRNWMVVTTLTLLGGCAASVKKGPDVGPPLAIPAASSRLIVMHVLGRPEFTKAADWDLLRAEWGQAMQAAAAPVGVDFRLLDGEPKTANEDGTLLVVHVNAYRYIPPGSRLGILGGNAHVDADVEFIDLRIGARYGRRHYDTSSSAWEVVVSAETDKHLAALSAELVNTVHKR
jgi:hypothetical protein